MTICNYNFNSIYNSQLLSDNYDILKKKRTNSNDEIRSNM